MEKAVAIREIELLALLTVCWKLLPATLDLVVVAYLMYLLVLGCFDTCSDLYVCLWTILHHYKNSICPGKYVFYQIEVFL